MAGLAILKHSYDLSDEGLCERWIENPYFQYFCGEAFFQHRLVADALAPAHGGGAAGCPVAGEPRDGDTHRGDEALRPVARGDRHHRSGEGGGVPDRRPAPPRARERLVRLAKKLGVVLRQSYARVGKFALIKHQRYAHAHQFKRAGKALRKLRTYLGRVIRDIRRKIAGADGLREAFVTPLHLAERVLAQDRRQRGRKVFAARARGRVHRQRQGAQAV
jgi:IS5 family transposase